MQQYLVNRNHINVIYIQRFHLYMVSLLMVRYIYNFWLSRAKDIQH